MSRQATKKRNAADKKQSSVTSEIDKSQIESLSPRSRRLLDNNKDCLLELGYSIVEVRDLIEKYHEDEMALSQQVGRMIDEAIEHPWRSTSIKSQKPSITQPGNERARSSGRNTQPRSERGRRKPFEKQNVTRQPTKIADDRREDAKNREQDKGAASRKQVEGGNFRSGRGPSQNGNGRRNSKSNKGFTFPDRRSPPRENAELVENELRSAQNPDTETKNSGQMNTARSWPRPGKNKEVIETDQKIGNDQKRHEEGVLARSERKQQSNTEPPPQRPIKKWTEVVRNDQQPQKYESVNDQTKGIEPIIKEAPHAVSKDTSENLNVHAETEAHYDDVAPSMTVTFSQNGVQDHYASATAYSRMTNKVESAFKVESIDSPVTIIETADRPIVIKQRPADAPKLNRRYLQQSLTYGVQHTAPPPSIDAVSPMPYYNDVSNISQPQAPIPVKTVDFPDHESKGRDFTADEALRGYPSVANEQFMSHPHGGDEMYYGAPMGLYPPRAPQYRYDSHDYVPYTHNMPVPRAHNADESLGYPPPHLLPAYSGLPKATAVPRMFPYEPMYGTQGSQQHPATMGMMPVGHYESHHQEIAAKQHMPSRNDHFLTSPPYGLPPLFLQAAPPVMMHGQSDKGRRGYDLRPEYTASGQYNH